MYYCIIAKKGIQNFSLQQYFLFVLLLEFIQKMKSRKKGEEMEDQTKVLLDSGVSWRSLGDSKLSKIRNFKEV